MFKNKSLAWMLFSLLSVVSACKEPEEVVPTPAPTPATNTNAKLNTTVYDMMKEWYLWNDQLPKVNIADYKTPEDLLDALRNQTDRWSYIEEEETLNQYFTGGQFVGHGFGMQLDADGNLRVSFVYKDSPMDKQGVTRGYKLTQVNGQTVSSLLANNTFSSALGENKAGVQNRFQVEDLMGKTREFTIVKEAVTMNTVLHRSVIQANGKKVGYLVFNTFIDKSIAELNEAFAYFKSQGVSELVLDLRYNGGGSLDVAQHLAGLIGVSKAGIKEFVELTYNAQKQDYNTPYNFKTSANDLNLNRLFVITSGSSASASEAVINGLKPYMEVITIGEATHGKPVGMNPMEIGKSGLVLVPITFKVANADGQAEYFNGIPVNGAASDDLAAQFGDATEDCLEQALQYIKTGSFSPVIASGRVGIASDRNQEIPLEGFRAEVGAF